MLKYDIVFKKFQFTFARYFLLKNIISNILSGSGLCAPARLCSCQTNKPSGGHVDQRENTSSMLYTANFEETFFQL